MKAELVTGEVNGRAFAQLRARIPGIHAIRQDRNVRAGKDGWVTLEDGTAFGSFRFSADADFIAAVRAAFGISDEVRLSFGGTQPNAELWQERVSRDKAAPGTTVLHTSSREGWTAILSCSPDGEIVTKADAEGTRWASIKLVRHGGTAERIQIASAQATTDEGCLV